MHFSTLGINLEAISKQETETRVDKLVKAEKPSHLKYRAGAAREENAVRRIEIKRDENPTKMTDWDFGWPVGSRLDIWLDKRLTLEIAISMSTEKPAC
jgi:hypothetical protein